MKKLIGEAALAHARATSAQLYYQGRPIDVATAAQELQAEQLGALSCEEIPSIVCPRCSARSFNRNDIAQRYCGRCHLFHEGA